MTEGWLGEGTISLQADTGGVNVAYLTHWWLLRLTAVLAVWPSRVKLAFSLVCLKRRPANGRWATGEQDSGWMLPAS